MNFIFLRGLGRESVHWEPFLKVFRKSFPQSSIVCLDLPGSGKFNEELSPMNISEYVDHLRERNNLSSSPSVIIAISLGGMVALEWGRLYPNEISELIIINSSACNLSPFWHRMQLKALWKLLCAAKEKNVERREELILQLTTSFSKIPSEILDENIRLAKERPVFKKNILRQTWAASCYSAPKTISMPVNFICSKFDRLVSMDCSHSLAKFYKSNLWVHPTAGHDLPAEDPKWLNATIQKILAEQPFK
jgi:pimeloyl-[acyl-carrier protein] methyl ester esterase